MGKYDLKGVREAELPAEQPAKVAPIPVKSPKSREPGKRSRPDFSRTTVYMRDATKLKAVRLLQDRKEDRDLSDLIESLVSNWVSKHSSV